jgi:hypothetical protein
LSNIVRTKRYPAIDIPNNSKKVGIKIKNSVRCCRLFGYNIDLFIVII